VVYTTHYLTELADLKASIAVASHGRVIARGSSAELLDGLPGEVRVRTTDHEYHRATTDPTGALMELIAQAQGTVESVELRNPDLDDLYRSLAVSDVH
jgi:ABC-2 type transport system ATP-binding protein